MHQKYRDYLDQEILPWLDTHVSDGYFRSVDGMKIHYHEAVNPQEKAAIVMIHGFCEFFGKHHENAYRFYQAGYSVFFIELRGHGKSGRVREYDDQRVIVGSFDDYVMDVEAFIDQIVRNRSLTKRLFLFAHSMGGAVGALFLEYFPDVFECAVLSSPMLKVDYAGIPDPAIDALGAVTSRVSSLSLMYAPGQHPWRGEDQFMKSSCMDRDRYEYQFAQRAADPDYQTWGGTVGWAAAAKKADDQIMKYASDVAVPVLICQAGNDAMVDNRGHTDFCNAADMAAVVSFPGAEHELFNADHDTRRAYYRTVLKFYSDFADSGENK